MKVRLTLQEPDYSEKNLGKANQTKALAKFDTIDWQGLALKAKNAGDDFCPPSLYVEFKNIEGYKLMLHFYCTDLQNLRFSLKEVETFTGEIADYAKRAPSPEKNLQGLSLMQVRGEIERMFFELPDKALMMSQHGRMRFATTYRDFKGGIAMMLFIVFACTVVCTGIFIKLMMQFPAIRPTWFIDFIHQYGIAHWFR